MSNCLAFSALYSLQKKITQSISKREQNVVKEFLQTNFIDKKKKRKEEGGDESGTC